MSRPVGYVDRFTLDKDHKKEICEMDTEGIRKLKRNGVYYEDLRYPNLRVQRLPKREKGQCGVCGG